MPFDGVGTLVLEHVFEAITNCFVIAFFGVDMAVCPIVPIGPFVEFQIKGLIMKKDAMPMSALSVRAVFADDEVPTGQTVEPHPFESLLHIRIVENGCPFMFPAPVGKRNHC